MTEADIEVILERAKELHPEAKPRIISDNGPQFIAKDFKEFIRISSGACDRALRRREEPNSSIGSHSTWTSDQEGPVRNHDPRLQTQRYGNPVCSNEHSRWHGHQHVRRSPSPSGMVEVSAGDRSGHARWTRNISNRRQLRHAQTSQSATVAGSPPAIPC